MAKDFTRSSDIQQPPSVVVQAKPPTVNGVSQTQTLPPKRSWQPQNSSLTRQGDREAEIVEALKNPEFLQIVAQVLKDRKEATIDAEEFVRHAVRQIQSRDLEAHDKLVQCTPASVQAAVKKLAVMGLSPNAEQGEGWLLPRWNKHASSYCAIAVPGVRGMEKKLMETGKVANIEARGIYLQDKSKVRLGTENVIEHEVNFCPDPARPNPIVGAYGIVTLKDGRREIAVKRLYQSPPKEPRLEQQQQQPEKEKSRGYMDEETNAKYLAQRPAMKGALNKFFKEDSGLQALLEMEHESYESSVNRDVGDTKVKVDPKGQIITIPMAQVEAGPQSKKTAQHEPADSKQKKTALAPDHPVDQIADKIRQQYEEQTDAGVRV